MNIGRNEPERTFEVSSHGTISSISMAPPMAMTPPSLLSMNSTLKSMARRMV
ncbi:hypothetical protein D3C72_2599290 [compost metagenome]